MPTDLRTQGPRQVVFSHLFDIFSHPVKDNDRIINRETDDCQNDSQNVQRKFYVENRDGTISHHDIVKQSNDTAQTVRKFVKPEGHIDQDAQKSKSNRPHGFCLQIFSNLWTYNFQAPDLHGVILESPLKRGLDRFGHRLQITGRLLHTDQKLVLPSEFLNNRVLQTNCISGISNFGNINRFCEFDPGYQTSCKVDPISQSAVKKDGAKANQNGRCRNPERDLLFPDKIKTGIMRD